MHFERRSTNMKNRLIDFHSPYIQTVLHTLLKDRTTRRNIIWATDNYTSLGKDYSEISQITEEALLAFDDMDDCLFQPRVFKSQLEQKKRTKGKAEVFTPSWLCNEMNNYCDEIWFERSDVFNKPGEKKHSWIKTRGKIQFSNEKHKTWQDYVDNRRMEITCGEAPYLVSRYDTTTGKTIPVPRRIGILDRKLRVVNENTENREDWSFWAIRAYQSTYGYEYQGDNLLIARVNLFLTFIENVQERWNDEPTALELMKIAHVISWNLWQMNGLTNQVPWNPCLEFEQIDNQKLEVSRSLQVLNSLAFTEHLTEDAAKLAKIARDVDTTIPHTVTTLREELKPMYRDAAMYEFAQYAEIDCEKPKSIQQLITRKNGLIKSLQAQYNRLNAHEFYEPQYCVIQKWSKMKDGDLRGQIITFQSLNEV